MNDQSSNPVASSTNDPLSPQKPSLSGDALMRRRLMLRGATGSAAALAALQPIGALATGQSTVLTCNIAPNKEALCSVSGVQSAAHSFGPNIVKIPAKGKNKSYWYSLSTWPVGCDSTKKVGGSTGLLSGASSGVSNLTLRAILNPSTANAANFNSIEADFVCAYLNGADRYALTPSDSKSFPYSKDQVLELWGKGGDTRTRARQLFTAISI